MVRAILARVQDDASLRVRMEDAVRRVLALKRRAGLLPCAAA